MNGVTHSEPQRFIDNNSCIRFLKTAPRSKHQETTYNTVVKSIINNIAPLWILGRIQLTDWSMVEVYSETGSTIVVTIADHIASAKLRRKWTKFKWDSHWNFLDDFSLLAEDLSDWVYQ